MAWQFPRARRGATTRQPEQRAGDGRIADRLLWQAEPLLVLATQLRATSLVADIRRLHAKMAGLLCDFQAGAQRDGVDPARVSRASDVLAALIDQVVASTPWGADSGWRSIAASAAGSRGLRPAQRLLEVAAAASGDAGMQELIGVAIALGFDKRNRGIDAAGLEELETRLIPGSSPAAAAVGALSPDLPRLRARAPLLTSWLPLWVSSLVAAALLAALYFGLVLSLGARSDRLFARLAAPPVTAAAAAALPSAAGPPRLAAPLGGLAASRSLIVHDAIDRSDVVVPEGLLFEPGEPVLKASGRELLRPIAAALKAAPGRIQVIGHTDGTLARSARYPSGWELSVDRARAVESALQESGVEAARLGFDGRGSVEPAAADEKAVTGDGRIEIVLLAGR